MLESRGIVYTTPFVLTNMYRARWGEELGYGITTNIRLLSLMNRLNIRLLSLTNRPDIRLLSFTNKPNIRLLSLTNRLNIRLLSLPLYSKISFYHLTVLPLRVLLFWD